MHEDVRTRPTVPAVPGVRGSGQGRSRPRREPRALEREALGVDPGARDGIGMTADRPALPTSHRHTLAHAKATDGKFGMVNTLIAVPTRAGADAIIRPVAS